MKGFWLSFLVMLLTTGCQSVTFYRQAVSGQWELWAQRKSLDQIQNDADAEPELKSRLALLRELKQFAANELGLPARRQYEQYVELNRPFVVWNVFAAPQFSVEAKSWWYPFVGKLDYQGYFREELALDYAEDLRAAGWDVYVGGVQAYSTLGWFRDPVLSTFVWLPEVELADLVFHELAHQRLFLAGDTEVNEAFATTVAREGVRRWLLSKGAQADLDRYLESRHRDDAVVALIGEARHELEALYERSGDLTGANVSAQKQEVLDRLHSRYNKTKQSWPGYAGYDQWMNHGLNNAKLNSIDAYSHWVPAMESILAGSVDLQSFYQVMDRLGEVGKAERRARLEWFEQWVQDILQPAGSVDVVGTQTRD